MLLSVRGVRLANSVKNAINILCFAGCMVSVTAMNSAVCRKDSHRQSVNDWAQICSNKTLFIKQGVEDYRSQLTDPSSKAVFFILIVCFYTGF